MIRISATVTPLLLLLLPLLLLLLPLLLMLLSAPGSAALPPPDSGAQALELRAGAERAAVSLNDMFREVEELMEETQHRLEEAVDQMTSEGAKSPLTADELQRLRSQTDARGRANIQDCVVDEDCSPSQFCLYEINTSRCLSCIITDMPCVKDDQCCSPHLCVWGQCSVNISRGSEGTICQSQSDCRADLCCAFQRELLFPVCNPRPQKGESCLNFPNLLMDMLAWDQEVPGDHCPCAEGLHCRPSGPTSVCVE